MITIFGATFNPVFARRLATPPLKNINFMFATGKDPKNQQEGFQNKPQDKANQKDPWANQNKDKD